MPPTRNSIEDTDTQRICLFTVSYCISPCIRHEGVDSTILGVLVTDVRQSCILVQVEDVLEVSQMCSLLPLRSIYRLPSVQRVVFNLARADHFQIDPARVKVTLYLLCANVNL